MKRKVITLLSLVCAIACAFSLAACGDTSETNTQATDISLNRTTKIVDGMIIGDMLQLTVGQTVTLTATLTPDNATSEITWQSDKPEIASVDGNGKITASKTGSAAITATANGKSAWCAVTVTAPSVSDFSEEAAAFVRNNIRPQVIGKDRDVKSETWSMLVNDDDTVDKLSILYIYASGKTERTVELADITLSSPLSFNSVLDNSASDVKLSVDRKTVFTFDVKYNYDNKEIVEELNSVGFITSNLKFIAETEASKDTRIGYNYLVVKDNQIDICKIEISKGNGSLSDIIYCIKEGYTYNQPKVTSYTMNGTIIYAEGYTYEK